MPLRSLVILFAACLLPAATLALTSRLDVTPAPAISDDELPATLASLPTRLWACGVDPHVAHHAHRASVAWQEGNRDEALTALRTCAASLRDDSGRDGVSGWRRSRVARAEVVEAGARAALLESCANDVIYFLESARGCALHNRLAAGINLLDDAHTADLPERATAARREEAAAFAAWRASYASGDRRVIQSARTTLREARARTASLREETELARWCMCTSSRPHPVSLLGLQQELQAGEVLVEYLTLPSGAWGAVMDSTDVRIVHLGAMEAILDAVEALDIHDTEGDPTVATRELQALLVEPLQLGADTDRVVVVPDGELTLLPFCLLFEELPVALVPSGSVWRTLREHTERRGSGILALGGPDYGRAPDTGVPLPMDASGRPPVDLAAASEEVRRIGGDVFVGKEASETTFRHLLAADLPWAAVHVACHGLTADCPEGCALALAPTHRDDGLLSAPEIEEMSITTDLVVLSACHSGEGPVIEPEGCVGLARAFLSAGATRVVASLGSVDDEATAALMLRFHQEWRKGVGAPEALCRAQAHVRAQPEWRHPHWWACWTVWGLAD